MTVLDHPLIADRVGRLREVSCSPAEFRRLVGQVARLMVPAVTEDLETDPVEINTPLETTTGVRIRRRIVLVPLLRAGLGLLDGFLDLLPEAQVAHLGLARNEVTLEPETYYYPPPVAFGGAETIVLDPMLATGGSAAAAIGQLKQQGADRIRLVCLLGTPEGAAKLTRRHPDVAIIAAALDRELDENGYIRPGLGDAGDRAFGTA